ncbi:MAG TPA: hypothetical protein VJ865_11875 [Gemmatimonadaceae bacterium]|nr:hypothetical protein [Gemmatimonadaceae bacterium]
MSRSKFLSCSSSLHLEATTYAIAHASTALVLKRRYPRIGLWPLLISVQFVELLWILFTYLSIEHSRITPTGVHLDFLPYSHSIGTGILLAALAIAFGRVGRRTSVGIAVALGVLSHILLDIIQHEPNIALLPMAWGPRIGLNLQSIPLLDFLVELLFCIACWKLFGGSRELLIGIVIFNLINLPLMFPPRSALIDLSNHPFILPTVILFEVVATWFVVWWFAKERLFAEPVPLY